MYKRSLEPIKTLIYSLRRYDDDRAAALIDFTDADNKDIKVKGFMSAKSKIYLVSVFTRCFDNSLMNFGRPIRMTIWNMFLVALIPLLESQKIWLPSASTSVLISWGEYLLIATQIKSYEMNNVMYVYFDLGPPILDIDIIYGS